MRVNQLKEDIDTKLSEKFDNYPEEDIQEEVLDHQNVFDLFVDFKQIKLDEFQGQIKAIEFDNELDEYKFKNRIDGDIFTAFLQWLQITCPEQLINFNQKYLESHKEPNDSKIADFCKDN